MEIMLGPAWQEPVKGDSGRKYYRVLLRLGVLGVVPCRIVENAKRANEKAPTHLIFHSPIADGDDVKVGALWPHAGAAYLLGQIELSAFGVLRLKGGATLDLRLVNEEIGIRLSAVGERKSDKSPTHQLWRLTPRSKAKTEPAAVQNVAGPDNSPAQEFDELFHAEDAEEEVLDEE